MTPDERAAAELTLNTLISNAAQIAIAIFAVCYFGWKAWVKWGAPVLDLLPERAPRYVQQEESTPTPAPVRSAAISPTQETETKPVPSFSDAGKQDGNALSVSPSLQEANAYAEMILIDRLADMVLAEKLDKSIAIKLGMRAPTGRAYQAAKEKLETVMRSKEYPSLTKDGRPIARSLRTSAK